MMSVELTPELDGLVQSIFRCGQYRDQNEVLGEALRLLQRRDQLRRDVDAGIEQLEEGQGIDGEKVFARLDAKASAIAGRAVSQGE
jgi:antitoxin ParD1/3/4